MKDGIYRLYVNYRDNAPLVSFAKQDFLHHHFNGKPELSVWKKPRIRISGSSKPLKDVLMGSFQAPIVSENFVRVMQPICHSTVEFLPLMVLRNVPYYVLNVIEVIDCLDMERSDIVYSPSFPDKIMRVDRFVFRSQARRGVPMFKIPQDMDEIFVRQLFIEAARENHLSGIGLDDPADIRLVKGNSPVHGFPT